MGAFHCVLAAAAVLLAVSAPLPAERWKLQYFHDEEKSTLRIADLAFSSSKRGVAVGAVYQGRDEKPTALVTSDGGEHWTPVPTKEAGISVYLLNDSLGWMVTPKGIWRTTEGGRNWTKLPSSPKRVLRVWFLDENHGFAVGMQKGAFETTDGGHKWTSIGAAAKPPSQARYTTYGSISFGPTSGEIVGWSHPPDERVERPAWMDPSAAISRREAPGVLAILQTKDRGKNWAASAIRYRGRVSRVRHGPGQFGLWLFEFGESFQFPSEVVRFDAVKNSLSAVYASKQMKATDVWITPGGTAYISGGEVLGQLRTLPVPGKVKVLRSTRPDFSAWAEMEVDYRAEASRTMMAGSGESDLWIATDTGMILKLVP